MQDELGEKVRCRFSLSGSVAYSTRMRRGTLSRWFSALLIFFRTALGEGIEILSHYRATERLVFRVVLIQKGQKWKITVAILHYEWGLYLARCYILYFYITGKCSLNCLQSVKPICANDEEIFSYTLLCLISYFTADTFCPSHRWQAQYPPIIYGPK